MRQRLGTPSKPGRRVFGSTEAKQITHPEPPSGLIDYLVPRDILANGSIEDRRRARLLVIAIAVANLSSAMIVAMLYFLGHTESAQSVAWTFVAHTLLWPLLYITKNPGLLAHVFMLLIFVEINWDFGRDDGYGVLAALVLPLGASALIGARAAMLWTAIAVLWAGYLAPFWLKEFSIPLSLSVACVTLVIGITATVIETMRDRAVREHAEAQAQLKTGESLMRSFLERTFPAHLGTNANGIVFASDGAAALLGTTKEGLKSQRLVDLIHPDDLAEALDKFEKFEGFRGEVRLKQGNGHWVWVEGFGVPLKPTEFFSEPNDAPWLFACRDIEAERIDREKLRQADRLEGVGVLAAGVAHDFNNLITIMRGFTEMMPDSEERLHVLSAADRAAELTSRLMAFGRQSPTLQSNSDVVANLQSWRVMFTSLLGEDVVLDINTPTDPVSVMMDDNQLNQVFLNLVTNAKEAMPHGGVVTIEVTTETLDTAASKRLIVPPGKYVRLDVRDTGLGMSEEVIKNAFDPFFTTKSHVKGSGLGLASVYGIVRRHAGAIEIHSGEEAGTRVTIWLPPAQNQTNTTQANVVSVELSNRLAGADVLVVEDDPLVGKWLERTLVSNGFQVRTENSALAALDRLKSQPLPALLITDIVMAEMRGTELARRARKDHPDLPVLFMSGYADTEISEWRALATYRAGFLAKPFKTGELLDAASALLDDDPPSSAAPAGA